MNAHQILGKLQTYDFIKTPAAALKAYESGLIPPDIFMYTGTSIRPLDLDLRDLNAISRVLARPNLDLETNLLLVTIFKRMANLEDPEIALFAAEGINQIEARFLKKIEKVRKAAKKLGIKAKRLLARYYYELALINRHTPGIRRYYLRESWILLRKICGSKTRVDEDLRWMACVLIALHHPARAERVMAAAKKQNSLKNLFLRAEIAFAARDYRLAARIITRIGKYNGQLPRRLARTVACWRGEA